MLKVMAIMPHQDDFEFNVGGVFAKLRNIHGDNLKLKILTTTRGASGHHEMSLEETFRRRENEAKNSASMIHAEYECMHCLDGYFPPEPVFIDRNFLGGLWNAIRDFEPEYIFCPPIITDPLAGIHIDHYNTAWAVRMVAYQLTVPHAFPTLNGTPKMQTVYPVIINVDDVYACERAYDFSIDISDVYELKEKMALCHESQIFEWLPWNAGSEKKLTTGEFQKNFRARHARVNERYGQTLDKEREYFRITNWGKKADLKQILDTLFGDISRFS